MRDFKIAFENLSHNWETMNTPTKACYANVQGPSE